MNTIKKESFVFYRSFFEALESMSAEQQGKCLMALADYALNGNIPSNEPETMMFFILVKPQIDANNKRFENGCKGGRPKNQTTTETKPKNNQKITKEKPNVNDNVNDNVNVNDNIKEKTIKKESKPTLEEVKQYCEERGNLIDPNEWFDYYSANGWKVGKNTMKDWKACVRYWEQKRKGTKTIQEEPAEDYETRKRAFFEKLGVQI